MTPSKKKVLFIGSFQKTSASGHVGGQMFACNTLINSALSDNIEWLLLDSTSASNDHISFSERLSGGIKRLLKYLYLLIFRQPATVLIFTAHGWSFIEKGLFALIGKIAGKKVIIAPRSGYIKQEIEEKKRISTFIYRVFNAVDYTICQGQNWKDMFTAASKVDARKFVVIENWINHENYISANRAEKPAGSVVKILFLSWVIEEKGIFDLIEAAREVVILNKNVLFIIGGNGTALAEAQKRVNDYQLNNYFDFRGWVKYQDKFDILQEVDIYTLPSYFEGFPNSLLEAMASGLPVVATPVGSIESIVKHGVNGLLVEMKNSQQIAQSLSTLINDATYRLNLGKAAQKSVLEKNTIATAIEKLKEIL